MSGTKYDSDKTRYDLVPAEALEAMARVFTYGSFKYENRNWEEGIPYGQVFAACMRHMWKWWRKEASDDESGMSHLWHAACCLFMLISYEIRGYGDEFDNRQPGVGGGQIDAYGIADRSKALKAKREGEKNHTRLGK